MIVESLTLGSIEVDQQDIITFEAGLPGFEQLHLFVMLHPDPAMPFSYLQSTEDVTVSLLAVNPFAFYPQYDFKLAESVQEELGIETEQDVAVLSVVTLKEQLEQSTLNLIAPIIINTRTKMGRQIILTNSSYQHRHPLIQAASQKEE